MSALWTHLVLNLWQVGFILLFSPLVEGVLHRLEEIIQGKSGVSVWQTYRDIWKLFAKDEVISEQSTWVFRFAPIVAFVMPLFVVLLIPALTAYPLFFAFMGDMVAVGFLMAISGFFVALGGMDTGNLYAAVGASRTHMVGFLAEPVFIMVFFSVSYVANSTIPYFVTATWGASWASMLQPAHFMVILAFFLLILADEGRIPVDSPAGKVEIAMIGHSKGLEYSGTSAALMKWGGANKLMVLALVFVNVLVTPWGLAQSTHWTTVMAAMGLVLLKLLAFVIILALVETTLAKLRLFRISEFLAVAFIICLFAVSIRLTGIA